MTYLSTFHLYLQEKAVRSEKYDLLDYTCFVVVGHPQNHACSTETRQSRPRESGAADESQRTKNTRKVHAYTRSRENVQA